MDVRAWKNGLCFSFLIGGVCICQGPKRYVAMNKMRTLLIVLPVWVDVKSCNLERLFRRKKSEQELDAVWI